MFVSMAIYPNPVGIIGAPYYLFSILTMVLGVYIFGRIIKPRIQNKPFFNAKSATLSTVCAVFTRTLLMLPMDFLVFPYLVSIGFGFEHLRRIQQRFNGNAGYNSVQHYSANICDSDKLLGCKKGFSAPKISNCRSKTDITKERREWDSNPCGPGGPRALKARALTTLPSRH